MTHSSHTVTILGSGTMGAGIAQVAVTAGWDVELSDVNEATVGTAISGILKRLNRLVEKGRLTAAQRDDAARRIRVAAWPGSFSECELVIEAVFEDFQAKVEALAPIVSALPSDAIIASNTSSLSIGRIGEAIGRPDRTIGMHFFNPAPLMKLVEVIAGTETDPAIAATHLHAQAEGVALHDLSGHAGGLVRDQFAISYDRHVIGVDRDGGRLDVFSAGDGED